MKENIKMTDNVFNTDGTQGKATDTAHDNGANSQAVFNDNQGQHLSELVGEGKKYSTVEELAKAYHNADSLIQQLQGENAGMREDLSKRQTAEEIAETIRRNQNQTDHGTQENTPSAVSVDDIQNLVSQSITQHERNQTASRNVQKASDDMVSLYGDKATSVLESRAKELGLTVEDLKNTAAQSPSAFLRLVGETDKPASANTEVEQSSINTVSFDTSKNNPKQLADNYKKLRKDNPKQYWSPKVQNEMFKLVKEGKLEL
jgi:hypothetical protein